MKNTISYNKVLYGALALFSACAQQISNDTTGNTTRMAGVSTTSTRVCPLNNTINGVTGAELSSFYGTVINADYIEGPVTYCLAIAGFGSSVDSGFAVELEQGSSTVNPGTNNGILYVEFGQTAAKQVKSSVVLTPDPAPGTVAIDLIYRDDYGLVQVKGNGSYGSLIPANIRFYNFPSYQDALTQAAQQAQAACLASIAAGDGTAAQTCWGLTPALDKAWWLQDYSTDTSLQTQMQTAAESALNSQYSVSLGSINIDLSTVIGHH